MESIYVKIIASGHWLLAVTLRLGDLQTTDMSAIVTSLQKFAAYGLRVVHCASPAAGYQEQEAGSQQ